MINYIIFQIYIIDLKKTIFLIFLSKFLIYLL